jgi:hypothetical protein
MVRGALARSAATGMWVQVRRGIVRWLAAAVAVTCALTVWSAAASAATPSTSVLVNGDFSQSSVSSDGNSIPGWTATNSCGIEVWGPGSIGAPLDAGALELASNCVSGVQQTVSDTPGQQYLVTYYFAARSGTSQSENAIQASFNGTAEQSESTSNTTPQPYSFTVTGTGSDVLTFADTNPISADSVGTLLALVSMQPVQAGPQLQWPAADVTGASTTTLTASGKFDDASGDPLTLTADNTVGTFTDNGDGSWSWTYTPSQANAATPITVTASDGNGNTATDTFTYTTVPQGVSTGCLPSGPWNASANLQLVGMPPGDIEEAYVTDSAGNLVDYFDDWNAWNTGSGVDANGNETLTADGYETGDVLQPGTSVSVNVYSEYYGWFNATYSVPVCGLDVPSSTVTATTSNPNGAPVSFSVSDMDYTDGSDPVSCTDPAGTVNSGDEFPVGSTTVSCTSTDSTGSTTSASFVVQVTGPPAAITVSSDASVERGASIAFTGEVTDSAGDPVSGATVRLTGAGIDPAQATAATGGDGSFTVRGTPMTAGTDTVTAFVDNADSGRQDPSDPSATTQVTVTPLPTQAYASCAQVQAQRPLAGDGTYFIDFGNGAPVAVYCSGMAGSDPQPYLTLQNTGSGANYFQNTFHGGTTYYTRVHLVPFGATVGGQTCESVACIDTSDTTFANSGGYPPLNYGNLSTCGWAQANGNVDLTGTPFAVAPNAFTIGGWGWWGAAQYSANGQVVNLSVGGDCGGANPTTDPILPLTLLLQAQTIAFPATGVTYGQSDFSPAAASSGEAIAYSNASGACTIDSQGLVQITGAGSCTVTADQPGDAAYSAATSVTQTFPVAPAPLTVDAQDATTTFGTAPTLTGQLDGFVNGDTLQSAGITGSADCAVASVIPADAGTYPDALDCSQGTLSSPNGDYTFVSGRVGTLTITPASQTISLTSSPVTYGQADFNPAAASSGLPVSLSGAGGACTIDGQGDLQITGAGQCAFIATQGGDNNYLTTGAVPESFQVSPATLTVDAQDATTTYGTAPSLTSQLDGFVNGDTAQSAGITGSPSCSVASGTSSDAGSYPQAVTCSTGTLASPDGDYTFTTGRQGTLTINSAPQSIAFPATGVTYGQPDYSPASSSSGLGVSYTNPSGACAIDKQGLLQITGAGNCTVTAVQGGNRDYQAAAPVTQTVAVAKAPLTVDANPASTVYGQAPSLSATPHGFVNGDTLAGAQITGTAACSLAPGTGTDVGSYSSAITCAPGSLSSANYSVAAGARATLTITPASQAITLTSTPPATPLLGGTYTVTSKAGASGNPVVISVDGASTSGACKVSGAVVSFSGLGTCVIDASQAPTKDYTAAPQLQQKFVIEQPTTTTVTSSANPSILGQSITFTATIAGPTGSSHVPAGTVTFENGTTPIGTATLSNGAATLTASTLSQATHAITVVYGGDTLDQGSTSSTLSQQVLAANAGGVTSETTSFVESSPKFQALPPATQKTVSTILSGISSALASFTPTLTPAQLKLMTTAYDAAITALQNQGYLTAAQASILDSAAGDLS